LKDQVWKLVSEREVRLALPVVALPPRVLVLAFLRRLVQAVYLALASWSLLGRQALEEPQILVYILP